MSNDYEERATMIAAVEFTLTTRTIQQSLLCGCLQECWLLRKGSSVDSDENEEELYAAGNMVIGSRGNKSQASHVYKAFTSHVPNTTGVDFILCRHYSEMLTYEPLTTVQFKKNMDKNKR
uniref:Uncharacterized protein n=1 Tax=Oncorhynchus kisutch TaxID=8019 RepID=A0A8C7GSI4_ONCKI